MIGLNTRLRPKISWQFQRNTRIGHLVSSSLQDCSYNKTRSFTDIAADANGKKRHLNNSSSDLIHNTNPSSSTGGIFVSKHFAISPSDLSKVVGETGYFKDYRLKQGGELDVKTCFADCERQRKGQGDNAWKLLIRRDGSYYCHRCSASGNWYQLKRRLAGGGSLDTNGSRLGDSLSSMHNSGDDPLTLNQDMVKLSSFLSSSPASTKESMQPPPIPDQAEAFGYHLNLTAAIYNPLPPGQPLNKNDANKAAQPAADDLITTITTPPAVSAPAGTKPIVQKIPTPLARQQVLQYLRQNRGLNDEIIQRYGVGCAVHSFPVYPDDAAASVEKEGDMQLNPGANESRKSGPEWHDKVCVTFPWMEKKAQGEGKAATGAPSRATSLSVTRSAEEPSGKYAILRVKMRALSSKSMQRLLPKGGGWAFFGWHTVQPTHRQVVITEGEYDAMAVAQGLAALPEGHALHIKNLPAISLPNGCNSLPPSLLPQLEQFDKIYLWLDNDKPGQEAAEKFARKLGINRCLLVRPPVDMLNPPKDANDALRAMHAAAAAAKTGKPLPAEETLIPKLLAAAKPVSHNRLETFASLRGEVLRNIRQPEALVSGTPTPSLPVSANRPPAYRSSRLPACICSHCH